MMLEEQVKVTRIDGQIAWVEGLSADRCSGCAQISRSLDDSASQQLCSSALLRQYMGRRRAPLAARCHLTVQPGDVVVIGVDERAMLWGSLLVYVLPLCSLMVGAILAELLATKMGLVAEWPTWLGGLAAFAICLFAVKKLPGLGAHALQPVVLRKA